MQWNRCKCLLAIAATLSAAAAASAQQAVRATPLPTVSVGRFEMDFARKFQDADRLLGDNVTSIAAGKTGSVFAGGSNGLAEWRDGNWIKVAAVASAVHKLAATEKGLAVAAAEGVLLLNSEGAISSKAAYPANVTAERVAALAGENQLWLAASTGAYELQGEQWVQRSSKQVSGMAVASDGRVALAAADGLFTSKDGREFQAQYPHDGTKSWAPRDVRAAVFDSAGRLWFACPQGVGQQTADGWRLFTGDEGLPYDDFTCAAAGPKDSVWFGTTIGAIRKSGTDWFYRQGRAWLPDDRVRAVAVDQTGSSWFATARGIGVIERKPITLAEKARYFESEIDKYHRRTPYEYVLGVSLGKPGDKSTFRQHDSDNDGLWTSMYGAGQAFAFAATKDLKAKERAKTAFEAVRFLSQVTQGGSHPAPHGFPARTILPTSGANPNATHYTPDKDREEKRRDPLWKVIVPRWPTSADGKWYWKTDTSSDELDGHYFFYAVYYDLVADTAEEKARVRDVVTAITDHLIDHDFELVDHDGKPTRWGRFSPAVLNGDILVNCRGLNSLSLLSYLKVAEHVTGGGKKYVDAYNALINHHHYATNTLNPKYHFGVGTGNQSDDEMAFMCYYTLLQYEKDPVLLAKYYRSFATYWTLEAPERCPLFNFIFLAMYKGGVRGRMQSSARGTAEHVEDGVETLKRYPLDRVRWGFKNSHRRDIVLLRGFWGTWGNRKRGHLRTGKVVPIDERFVEHWNHDPWVLDEGSGGHSLADGNSFLLPYYLGLYHGFIRETETEK